MECKDMSPQEIYCMFCANEMILKVVFGKQMYECVNCKRLVPVDSVIGGIGHKKDEKA